MRWLTFPNHVQHSAFRDPISSLSNIFNQLSVHFLFEILFNDLK